MGEEYNAAQDLFTETTRKVTEWLTGYDPATFGDDISLADANTRYERKYRSI